MPLYTTSDVLWQSAWLPAKTHHLFHACKLIRATTVCSRDCMLGFFQVFHGMYAIVLGFESFWRFLLPIIFTLLVLWVGRKKKSKLWNIIDFINLLWLKVDRLIFLWRAIHYLQLKRENGNTISGDNFALDVCFFSTFSVGATWNG